MADGVGLRLLRWIGVCCGVRHSVVMDAEAMGAKEMGAEARHSKMSNNDNVYRGINGSVSGIILNNESGQSRQSICK